MYLSHNGCPGWCPLILHSGDFIECFLLWFRMLCFGSSVGNKIDGTSGVMGPTVPSEHTVSASPVLFFKSIYYFFLRISHRHTLYFDHAHPCNLLPKSFHIHGTPPLPISCLLLINNILNPVCAAPMGKGVRLLFGAWPTYQGPHFWRKQTLLPWALSTAESTPSLHAVMLDDLFLHRSYAVAHSSCAFVAAAVLLCPKDAVLLWSFLTSDAHSLSAPSLIVSLILEGRNVE